MAIPLPSPPSVLEPKDGFKFCNKCHRELPATRKYFHIGRRNVGGLIPICKECRGSSFKEPEDTKTPRDGYKICSGCERELPADIGHYDKDNSRKDGFQYLCKECRGRKFQRVPKQGFRICSKCDKELPLEHFYRRTNGNYDGLCRLCKALKGRKEKHTRKAKKIKTISDYHVSEWRYCVDFFDYKCAYCGITQKEHLKTYNEQLHQDHFIPLSKYGNYTKDNIIPACKTCNCSKNDKDFFEWYPEQEFYNKTREVKILNYLKLMEDENNERDYI